MKVAVCLSGQARFAEENYSEIRTKILEPAGNPDIFCYFWNTEDSRIGTAPNTAVKLYRPIRYKIEPQKIFDTAWIDDKPTVACDNKTLTTDPEWLYWNYQRILSMFYSIKQVNALINGVYDCVIRCRTDNTFERAFDLEEFKSDTDALWCYRLLPRPPEWNLGKFSYGDEFCFGNQEVMSTWSSVYDNIPQIIEALNLVRPEKFLTYHIEELTNLGTLAKVSKIGVPAIKRNEHSNVVLERPEGP